MVVCCVVNCTNSSKKKFKLFKIPKFTDQNSVTSLNIQQRMKNQQFVAWVEVINKKELDEDARVCSAHFTTGKPAKWSDNYHADWLPHLNMGYDCDQKVIEALRDIGFEDEKSSNLEVAQHLFEEEPQDFSLNDDDAEERKEMFTFVGEDHKTPEKQSRLLSEINERARKECFEVQINDLEDINDRSYDDLLDQLNQQHQELCRIQESVCLREDKSETATQTDETGALFEKMQKVFEAQNEIIKNLRAKIERYEHHESVYKDDDSRSLYYTGLNFKTLNLLYEALEPAFPQHGNRKLTKFQCLILTLMRMRLGLSFTDLSYRFDVSLQTASRVFHSTLHILYSNLKQFIVWPDRDVLRKTMPRLFIEKLGHRKLTCIIDCFEVFVQRPGNPLENCQVWSEYKHHQTIKFLIAITPQGSISFISKAYAGRTSDKEITNKSGFLNKLIPGDYVAADRGFTVESEIQMMHSELIIPTYMKGQKQLLPKHIESTRKLASYRIHVERIIGQLKNKYRFFSMCLPTTTLFKETNDTCVVDQMVTVCCALINLCPPIIIDKDDD